MGEEHMTNFLYTDARWTEHFVEVSDPHKEGHHVRFYFERPWVGLTEEEIDQGLLRSNHALQTAGAWRDGVEWATKQLREKNNG